MDIQSAFNAGVQGFQNATEQANQAATNIVKQTTRDAEELNSAQQAGNPAVSLQAESSAEPVNLTEEVVNLKVAEFQAKASAEVIQTADETVGTLLNVTA